MPGAVPQKLYVRSFVSPCLALYWSYECTDVIHDRTHRIRRHSLPVPVPRHSTQRAQTTSAGTEWATQEEHPGHFRHNIVSGIRMLLPEVNILVLPKFDPQWTGG